MAVREILRMGDERLLRVAQAVPETMFGGEEMRSLIDDLVATMHAASGAGIAAPQIGVDLRVVILVEPDAIRVTRCARDPVHSAL